MSGFFKESADDLRTVARGWRWGLRPQVPRSAEPFVPEKERYVFPTAWARGKRATAVREVIQSVGLKSLLHAEVRPLITGLDSLGRVRGPVVFVANHASHVDTALVLSTLPKGWRQRTAVAAAADYFFDTWWRAIGSALIFNTFPIERRGGGMASTPGDVLDDGWSLLIFPEGTRSKDGWMGDFHAGAGHLAIRHGVPIVPIAIRGSFAAMPRGAAWVRPGRPQVTIRYGDAVVPRDGESPRALVARARADIARLLDEDTTSWWEARRRAAEDATPDPSGPPVAAWRRVWEQTAPPQLPGRQKIWAR